MTAALKPPYRGHLLLAIAALAIGVPGARAQEARPELEKTRVETDSLLCDAAGRTRSRVLTSPDNAHQAFVEVEVTRRRNRCRVRWVLHASVNTGKSFRAKTVTEAPPLGEDNGFVFDLIGFTASGRRVLVVQNEWLGDWQSRTAVVYDFKTRSLLKQDVNSRIERLPPDDCPVHGLPIGFVSDDTVALVIVSDDDVDDEAFRCWPETQWGLNMRTGELRRLAVGERVMAAGVVLDLPAGP